jgi:hypothetical protein
MVSLSSQAFGADGPEVTTVHLFVRSLSPDGDGGRVEELVARLDDLADPIDTTVHIWGDAVGVAPIRVGGDLVSVEDLLDSVEPAGQRLVAH